MTLKEQFKKAIEKELDEMIKIARMESGEYITPT